MKRIYQYLLRNAAQVGSQYTLTLSYTTGHVPNATLASWNAQIGGNYTSLQIQGSNVILSGGSNVTISTASLNDIYLLEVNDDGSVIDIHNNAFKDSGVYNVYMTGVTSIKHSVFKNCPLTNIYLPACTDLGGTVGDNNVFEGIAGQTINATFNQVLQDAQGTLVPDGDIVTLNSNNFCSITYV